MTNISKQAEAWITDVYIKNCTSKYLERVKYYSNEMVSLIKEQHELNLELHNLSKNNRYNIYTFDNKSILLTYLEAQSFIENLIKLVDMAEDRRILIDVTCANYLTRIRYDPIEEIKKAIMTSEAEIDYKKGKIKRIKTSIENERKAAELKYAADHALDDLLRESEPKKENTKFNWDGPVAVAAIFIFVMIAYFLNKSWS